MATRTIKLIGKAYSSTGDVNVVVNFNNSEVFNGTVATENGSIPSFPDDSLNELASWTIDTSVTGSVPLSIAVSGGDFHFNNLIGNYSGYELQETDGIPDIVDNAFVVIKDVDEYFGELNFNTTESDGKDNVTFSDGSTNQSRNLLNPEDYGDWIWKINNGVTLSCNFHLDPDFVVLETPTYEPGD